MRVATEDRRQEFEQVALIHLDSVFRMALRLCQNRTQAEDLVQETYLRALRHFDQFAPGTNCRAWLFAILHNTFVNLVKRDSRQVLEADTEELHRFGAESSEVMGKLASPEEEIFQRLVVIDLLKALKKLPARYRQAVFLADVQGCLYKEIAQICGVPIGTVMSRLFRGRRLLRKAPGGVRSASGAPER